MVVGMFSIAVAVLTNSLKVSDIESQRIHVRLLCQRTKQTLTLTSVPSDEKQFETYEAGYVRLCTEYQPTSCIDDNRHLLALIMDSDRDNPLFYSPIGDHPKNILDLGTGQGNWAMYAPHLKTVD